jgi:hypothetical protein
MLGFNPADPTDRAGYNLILNWIYSGAPYQ